MTIAGHTFVEDVNGRVCGCGIRWREIMGATEEHVGQKHWAHIADLRTYELKEIHAERDRVWDLLLGCVRGVAVVTPE